MNFDYIFIVNILQSFVLLILGLSTLYIFIFSLAGLFYKQIPYPEVTKNRKIAVLIPGYKEDNVIIEVAKDALLQDYPRQYYDVVIIADSFRPETLKILKELPIVLFEVSFEKSTKSKALNKALELLGNNYEIAVILDADNLMAKDFLTKINSAFESNFLAIQGHRQAKNLNTPLALLDAVSEEINNHIFRKGHRVFGLSSAVIGSGMAFNYSYFKKIMSEVKAIGGFDKEIELKMMKAGNKIEYLDDARIYDEKVQKAEVFLIQRRRWLSAQFHYFRQDFYDSLKRLILNGNIDYFNKAIQFIQPPRIMLISLLPVFGGIFIFVDYLLGSSQMYSILWIVVNTLCAVTFLFSIPTEFYNLKTLGALKSLPKGIMLMFGSLLKIKGANKEFLHTKHDGNTEYPD